MAIVVFSHHFYMEIITLVITIDSQASVEPASQVGRSVPRETSKRPEVVRDIEAPAVPAVPAGSVMG